MNFQSVTTAEVLYAGGINRLPDGKEAPSAILESAIENTDNSIGEIVSAAEHGAVEVDRGISDGQAGAGSACRPCRAHLANVIPNLLQKAGAPLATITEDDIALIWLQNQSTTQTAATALRNLIKTGTLDVYYGGVEQTIPARRVIDKILYGRGAGQSGSGQSRPRCGPHHARHHRYHEVGLLWSSPPNQYQDAREDHGGFSTDDTHVPLIVFGGAIPRDLQGRTSMLRVTSADRPLSALAREALTLPSSRGP